MKPIEELLADQEFLERMRHLAETAPERHKANAERWHNDPEIRAALLKPITPFQKILEGLEEALEVAKKDNTE